MRTLVRPFIRLFLAFAGCLAVIPQASAQVSTVARHSAFSSLRGDAPLGPNELCEAAHVLELAVLEGIQWIPANADYCELPSSSLPGDVITLLAHLRELHANYAKVVGHPAQELYGFGVRIHLGEHPTGPLASFSKDEVEVDVFRDFRVERFPDKIYAHELTHWLLAQGRFGEAAANLDSTYLFSESFPDLVASYVTNSLKIDFKDPSVRESLVFGRDGSSLHSMNAPLAEFYLGRFQREPLEICAKISVKKMSSNEKRMCNFFRSDREELENRTSLFAGALEAPPTDSELAAPFRPERCLIHYKNGSSSLDACFKNALGSVLISFIRSIEAQLGKKPIASLLRAIDRVGEDSDHYRCEFLNPPERRRLTPRAVDLPVVSFVKVLRVLRDSLRPESRESFDQAWSLHGLDAWETLERLDRETAFQSYAYSMLVEENPGYVKRFNCASENPEERGQNCASKCEYLQAPPAFDETR